MADTASHDGSDHHTSLGNQTGLGSSNASPPSGGKGSRSRRFPIWLPTVLFCLIMAGYSAYWAYVRQEAQGIVEEVIADWRTVGIMSEWTGDISYGGYPGSVSATFADPRISAFAGGSRYGQTVSIAADGLRLDVPPFDLYRLIVRPSGPMVLTAPDGEIYTIIAGKPKAGLSFNVGAERLDIAMEATRVTSQALGELFAMQGGELHLKADAENNNALMASVRVTGPSVPGYDPADLPFSLAGDVLLYQAALAQGAMNRPSNWADWRRQGGELRVRAFAQWSDGAIVGVTGVFQPDDQGRIDGRDVIVKITEIGLLAEHLVALGVDQNSAEMVGGLLGAMENEDGVVELRPTVSGGDIKILGFTLAQIPPL